MNTKYDVLLDLYKEILLDKDVKSWAGISSNTLSEKIYKANLLPGNIIERDDSFTPVFTSHEFLPIKKAVNTLRILEYFLWANDLSLSKEEKLKGQRNRRTLLLLLSGLAEGTYKLESIDGTIYLRTNSSYRYTKKYSYGRLYPATASISHLSREFRYYLSNGFYEDVDIINAHPSILYHYALSRGISTPTLATLVLDRVVFYAKIDADYCKSPIDAKRVTLVAMNMTKSNFMSKSLNDLTTDLITVREKLYTEFYLGDINFRAAVDYRLPPHYSKNDVLMKTQSLFCFDSETHHIMSFKKFYISNIPPELHERSSFVPFFDGLYVYSGSMTYLNAEVMQSVIKKADLDVIIGEYNTTSDIQFKRKVIKPEDALIPKKMFHKIQSAINTVEDMDYKEILNKFKTLCLSDELIYHLENVLNSNHSNDIDIKVKSKKAPTKMSFDYEQLTRLQEIVRIMYNKLVHSLIHKDEK